MIAAFRYPDQGLLSIQFFSTDSNEHPIVTKINSVNINFGLALRLLSALELLWGLGLTFRLEAKQNVAQFVFQACIFVIKRILYAFWCQEERL